MKCPYCKKNIRYDCHSLDHDFSMTNDMFKPQYWSLVVGGFQIGHSIYGFYFKDKNSNTIDKIISEVKIEDSASVLNKFLKLKSFI
jgi:hypothetical protein